MKKTCLLIAGMLLPLLTLQAQVSNDSLTKKFKTSIFYNSGFGAANRGNISFQGNLVYEPKKFLVVGSSVDVNFDINGESGDPLKDGASSLAFFVGGMTKSSFGVVYAGLGPTFTTITYPRENYRQESAMGLKICSGFFLAFRYFGIGISPYYVYNNVMSYGGFSLDIIVGRVNVPNKR